MYVCPEANGHNFRAFDLTRIKATRDETLRPIKWGQNYEKIFPPNFLSNLLDQRFTSGSLYTIFMFRPDFPVLVLCMYICPEAKGHNFRCYQR